jgi:hypothetical protein
VTADRSCRADADVDEVGAVPLAILVLGQRVSSSSMPPGPTVSGSVEVTCARLNSAEPAPEGDAGEHEASCAPCLGRHLAVTRLCSSSYENDIMPPLFFASAIVPHLLYSETDRRTELEMTTTTEEALAEPWAAILDLIRREEVSERNVTNRHGVLTARRAEAPVAAGCADDRRGNERQLTSSRDPRTSSQRPLGALSSQGQL